MKPTSDTPLTDAAERALYSGGVDRHYDGVMLALHARLMERKLNMANQEIAAVIQAIVTAEKLSGDCTDVLDVVQTFIAHHKHVETQRDALGERRPYEMYWSHRALAAEVKLREYEQAKEAR